MRRGVVVAVFSVMAACRTQALPTSDLSLVADLSVVDLAVQDLAAPDLSVGDMTVQNDLEISDAGGDLGGSDMILSDMTVHDMVVSDMTIRDMTTIDLAGQDMSGPVLGTATNAGAGVTPHGVAYGDFNGDSKTDFVLVDADDTTNNVWIFLGNGDGTLQSPSSIKIGRAGGAGTNVAVALIDNDTNQDLIVGNGWGFSVFLGNGNGTFRVPTLPDPPDYDTGIAYPGDVAVGDLNGDGKLDVATVETDSTTLGNPSFYVSINSGTGTFGAATSVGPTISGQAILIANFDGSGKNDVAVIDQTTQTIGLYMNQQGAGNGFVFHSTPDRTLSTGGGPFAMAYADLDGANGNDFVSVNNTDGTVSVFLAKATAGQYNTGVTYTAGDQADDVAVADFDGDGHNDIVTVEGGHTAGNVNLLLNSGTGTFAMPLNYTAGNSPAAIAATPLRTGSTKPDVVVANFGTNNLSILLNLR